MDLQTLGDLAVDGVEELQELGVAVPRQALADHRAGQHVQGGEQRRGAVALVVMGHRARPSGHHRQRRLGAVQGLDLGLLVHAQHDRLLRRVQIQADHVDELVVELHLDFEAMELPSEPGLQLNIYTAAANTPTADGLKLLASWAASQENLLSERLSSNG